ncbi:hypothetical protein IEQ34_010113 [Dendrobium chrysotoxum]|uniref:Bulb-type lectin domain-containing protein n=1 Tax=Dendrobium chrysotoxum TaxID=161865 RepID=A0AAV7H3H4_DENCH|nr:hypothetical protein IEQ34_010113 [Dendrobium chrysotoxum]
MAVTTHSATFLVSIAVLVILATSTDSVNFYGNVLKSGGKLDTGESLVHGNYSFIMQNDCNLVLYDNQTAIWSSRTDNKGVKCFLVLQINGELVIISNYRNTVWRSETGGQTGKYALVLQPNGDVVVYGNPVWSTASAILLCTTSLFLLFTSSNSEASSNILMAGDTLTSGKSLSVGSYNLFMQDDCNLVLYDNKVSVWDSRTAGKGSKCFLHFQMNGELLILSPNATKPLWRTETGGHFNRFVLVLKPNGNAVVYGTAVWSTGTGTMKGIDTFAVDNTNEKSVP